MAKRERIEFISKNNNRITHIGGFWEDGTLWLREEQGVIEAVEAGRFEFFVTVNGRTVEVIVDSRNGEKYLKTLDDAESPDTLLNLPECS